MSKGNGDLPQRRTVDGVVEDVQIWSETSISGSSSGGGGFVSGAGGFVEAPRVQVSSVSSTFQKVFIRPATGPILTFVIDARTIDLAKGHRVKLNFFNSLLVAVQSTESGRWIRWDATIKKVLPHREVSVRSAALWGAVGVLVLFSMYATIFFTVNYTPKVSLFLEKAPLVLFWTVVICAIVTAVCFALVYIRRNSLDGDENQIILKYATEFSSHSEASK